MSCCVPYLIYYYYYSTHGNKMLVTRCQLQIIIIILYYSTLRDTVRCREPGLRLYFRPLWVGIKYAARWKSIPDDEKIVLWPYRWNQKKITCEASFRNRRVVPNRVLIAVQCFFIIYLLGRYVHEINVYLSTETQCGNIDASLEMVSINFRILHIDIAR